MVQADLCRNERVLAFPTLRFYIDGELVSPDYKMDRTVEAFINYVKRQMGIGEDVKRWVRGHTFLPALLHAALLMNHVVLFPNRQNRAG